MKNVSIALLGCGTVGKGVVDLLAMNGPLIEEQLNTKINMPSSSARAVSS